MLKDEIEISQLIATFAVINIIEDATQSVAFRNRNQNIQKIEWLRNPSRSLTFWILDH